MSSVNDVTDIPTAGKSLVIVAAVNNVLHFRIFDFTGRVIEDTDETKLGRQAQQIENLRKQLDSLWLSHELAKSEKERVIATVTSIIGDMPFGTTIVNYLEVVWRIETDRVVREQFRAEHKDKPLRWWFSELRGLHRDAALSFLMGVGRDAIPSLIDFLKAASADEDDEDFRGSCFQQMAWHDMLQRNQLVTLDEYIELTRSNCEVIRMFAAGILGNDRMLPDGAETSYPPSERDQRAIKAIPALIEMLGEEDLVVLSIVTGALESYGPLAREAIPRLEHLAQSAKAEFSEAYRDIYLGPVQSALANIRGLSHPHGKIDEPSIDEDDNRDFTVETN